jgi:hypothetical protein
LEVIMTEEQLVSFSFKGPIELDNAIRMIAARERTGKSEIMRQALEQFIASRGIVVSVDTLPAPEGAEPVVIVTVRDTEPETTAATQERLAEVTKPC